MDKINISVIGKNTIQGKNIVGILRSNDIFKIKESVDAIYDELSIIIIATDSSEEEKKKIDEFIKKRNVTGYKINVIIVGKSDLDLHKINVLLMKIDIRDYVYNNFLDTTLCFLKKFAIGSKFFDELQKLIHLEENITKNNKLKTYHKKTYLLEQVTTIFKKHYDEKHKMISDLIKSTRFMETKEYNHVNFTSILNHSKFLLDTCKKIQNILDTYSDVYFRNSLFLKMLPSEMVGNLEWRDKIKQVKNIIIKILKHVANSCNWNINAHSHGTIYGIFLKMKELTCIDESLCSFFLWVLKKEDENFMLFCRDMAGATPNDLFSLIPLTEKSPEKAASVQKIIFNFCFRFIKITVKNHKIKETNFDAHDYFFCIVEFVNKSTLSDEYKFMLRNLLQDRFYYSFKYDKGLTYAYNDKIEEMIKKGSDWRQINSNIIMSNTKYFLNLLNQNNK